MARKFIIGLWSHPEDTAPWLGRHTGWRTDKRYAKKWNKIEVDHNLRWILFSFTNYHRILVEEVKDG